MGKIKGWIKKNDYTWVRKDDSIILINNLNKNMKSIGYSVEIVLWETPTRNLRKIIKNFKTKKEATDYAMKYMRGK